MTRTCNHCGATTKVVRSTRSANAQQAACCKAWLARRGITWGRLATTADVQALVDQHKAAS